jgi:hypothetical protein
MITLENRISADLTEVDIDKEFVLRFKAAEKRSKVRWNKYKDSIGWIELLLETPVRKFRPYLTTYVLAPYLMNIRKFSRSQASNLLLMWLEACDVVCKVKSDMGVGRSIRFS